INEEMKLAAAHALAGLVPENELRADRIITEVMDERVVPAIAAAVAEAARRTGVARI
ncbi:MAG: NAD-dependent malic enzyme, partial [Synergistaceae bacterium]|nr:NAD-dependent malic enzyme [Synergistaceae bacterium]